VSENVGQGFGRILAEARTAKGLTVAAVAEKLKLSTHQVEALEAEDYSRLPATVFVRGFVRNYARLLDLSAEQMPGLNEPVIEPTNTITAPSENLVFRTSSVRRWLLLPLAGLILFMILVAALYAWLRQGEEAYLTSAARPAVVQTAPAPVRATPVQVVPAPSAEPTPPDVAASAQSAVSAGAGASATAANAAAAQAKDQPTTPKAPENDPAAVTEHALHLAVQDEDAWIEVVSADQKRFGRLLRAGEQMTVRGIPPLKLVVGNALHVRLTYDDKTVDLHPYTGDKVARLTLQ